MIRARAQRVPMFLVHVVTKRLPFQGQEPVMGDAGFDRIPCRVRRRRGPCMKCAGSNGERKNIFGPFLARRKTDDVVGGSG